MNHFNGQQGCINDPRLKQILASKPSFPLAFWSFIDRKCGIDAVAGLHANGGTFESVGLHDIALGDIVSDGEYANLHVYADARIDKQTALNGVTHVMQYGYVRLLMAEDAALVHISGIVDTLHVSGNAQVYIHSTATVHTIRIHSGGYVKIERGASVDSLDIADGAKCMCSDRVYIKEGNYRTAKGFARVFEAVDATPFIKVRYEIHKFDVGSLATVLTNMYQRTRKYSFKDVELSGIFDCHVYALTDCDKDNKKDKFVLEFCAGACNKIEADLPEKLRHPGYYVFEDAVVRVFVEGEPLQEWLSDDTVAEGLPHRTHDRGDIE